MANEQNTDFDRFYELLDKETEESLTKRSNEHFFDDYSRGVMILQLIDGRYDIVYTNSELSKHLSNNACGKEGSNRHSIIDILYPIDIPIVMRILNITQTKGMTKDTYRMINSKGDAIWFMAMHKLVHSGDNTYIYIFLSPMHNFIGIHRQLQADNDKWYDIINSIPIGLMVFEIENNISKMVTVNSRLIKLSNALGSSLDGKKRNWTKEDFFAILNQNLYAFSLEADIPGLEKMIKDSETSSTANTLFRLRGSTEKKSIWINATCSSKALAPNKRIYYVTYQDATEQVENVMKIQENNRKLLELSYLDSLTGLSNRNVYNELSDAARHLVIPDTGIAFCDVNGLKATNDSLGHAAGDKLIVDFATMLKESFGDGKTIRISGDEFLVLINNIEEDVFSNRMNTFTEDCNKNNNIASVGYEWFSTINDLQAAVSDAEKLMYVQKQQYYSSIKNK